MDLGLYWAMAVNCPDAIVRRRRGETAAPCLECAVCRQIAARENLDLWLYDGAISNKMDDERAGPERALRMENIRELKASLGNRPHGGGKRVVLLRGMGITREEALNSLLKMLEEPGENTVFGLLAPQRGQILPTLVSRSLCLTLPWPGHEATSPDLVSWEEGLARFLSAGTGFLEQISARGAVDAPLAGRLILACQRSLVRVMSDAPDVSKLDRAFAGLTPEQGALAANWLWEAEEMLEVMVNPVRVLEGLASQLYLLCSPARRSGV